jgi:3-methyladenine DNA glycosylase AlkD
MIVKDILAHLEGMENPEAAAAMSRYGINSANTYGVAIPKLRVLAKEIGKDHEVALGLRGSRIHEARILACFADQPELFTEQQIEGWVQDFDSWDVCDRCCSALIDKLAWARTKALERSTRQEEYVKRAGFALMVALAVHDKQPGNDDFMPFLEAIRRESWDDRNYVKKAVNWAVRQIGERSPDLAQAAVETARAIQVQNSRAGRWIAADALRELTSDATRARIVQRAAQKKPARNRLATP